MIRARLIGWVKRGEALHSTLSVGIIGIVATLAINLAGIVWLNHPAAAFLSEDWWAT